jgi:hypothetical protein
MNLRERNFPLHYWLQLHNHAINSSPPPAKKIRHPSKIKINKCLVALSPHIQKMIYGIAIDKRKGEIRSNKFPRLRKVSSKFRVYKFLVFSEILVHSFKPPIGW